MAKSAGKRGVSPGAGEKTPGGRKRAGGPTTGSGAKARGSHAGCGGSDALATTPLDSSPNALDLFTGPSVLDDIPSFVDQPAVMELPRGIVGGPTRNELQHCRAPSVKNAGRDVDGKVIPHKRSEEIARVVAEYAAGGASENFICAVLNLRPGQLRQYYGHELMYGKDAANAAVASTALAMATSGENDQMTKFWLKARGGWRDGDSAQDAGSLLNIHIHGGE